MNKRNRPVEITDAPEHRSIPRGQISLRADDESGALALTGYASTFEPYEMYGGPAAGGWIEQIAPTAFDKTLREKPDLHLLINHEGMPLARTKSGTLQLSVDKHGLKVNAPDLDRTDPDVQRLEPKMRRKDMDEMSFAFRVRAQTWSSHDDFPDDPYAVRIINEVSLHKGDVSVVNFGANPTTHAEVKSVDAALAVLAECDPGELVEARSANDSDVLRRAQAALDMLSRRGVPGRTGTVYTGPLDDTVAAALAVGEGRGGPGGAYVDQTIAVHRSEAAPADEADEAPAGEGVGEAGEGTDERADAGKTPTGHKPMSRAEALRRVGLAPEDGKPMSRAEAEALVAAEQEEIDALRSAEYATRYADIAARLAPPA